MIKEKWYFDCGCSQHITGNNYFLTDLQPSSQDWVIFEDCGNGRVQGIGSLIIPGLSKLKNVFLVEGLTVNLISVSQLCDKDLLVKFTKDECVLHNQNHCHIMEGEITSDKCYLLTNANKVLHNQGN